MYIKFAVQYNNVSKQNLVLKYCLLNILHNNIMLHEDHRKITQKSYSHYAQTNEQTNIAFILVRQAT